MTLRHCPLGRSQSKLSAHSYDTLQRVQSYLDAGFEVVVHDRPVALNGWVGAGIIAIDPNTGAGAYIVDGGSNGGFLTGLGLGLLQGAAAIVMSSAGLAAITGIGGLLISTIVKHTQSLDDQLSFNAGRLLGIVAGMTLAIILGQYVLVTLSPLFVIGLFVLMSVIIQLAIIEISLAMADG